MTAIQHIERGKGASAERRVIMADIRRILKLYGGKDVVLQNLLDTIQKRENAYQRDRV